MMKRAVFSTCVMALVLFTAQSAVAQYGPPPLGAGAQYGPSYACPFVVGARFSLLQIADDSLDGRDLDFDPTTSFGLNLSYYLTNMLSVELDVGYDETDMNRSFPHYSETIADIKQFPILLTGRVHFPFFSPMVVPYAGIGVGYYINDGDIETRRLFAPGTNLDVDNSFGFHVNGGVDFWLTPQYGVAVDLKYVWTQPDVELTGPFGSIKDSVNLDALQAGVCFKFRF